MRIYSIRVEHIDLGRNFSSFNVLAKDFKSAVRAAEKKLAADERVESVNILADTED